MRKWITLLTMHLFFSINVSVFFFFISTNYRSENCQFGQLMISRVGPKNQLNGDKSQQDVIPIIRKHAVISDNFDEDDFVERDLNKNNKKSRKKHRSTTSSLPADLILTNLTEDGPKPAAKRIRWSDDENGDSYDFKRQRKQSFNDVDSEEED